jgi:carbamoyl-phosphate synthase large subunit
MNVLLTCAGRRNFLMRLFQDALAGRGHVFACDSSPNAPALAEAHASFTVPPMGKPEYYETLLALCREHGVGMLVSVHDLELGELARRAPCFAAAGTRVMISAPETVALCQDKWTAFQFLRSCEIPTPATFLSLPAAQRALARGLVEFPLLVKPRWGTSSIGLMRVESERELELASEWAQVEIRRSILAPLSKTDPTQALIIQEHVEGHEYGLDVVNDLEGRHVATLARRKLAMRAGNTDRAVSVCDPRLDRIGRQIGQHLGHCGSLDCDVIVAQDRGYVLDLNPRLGGGYPFSHLAGANLPAALVAWALDEEPDPAWFRCRPGVLVSKYDGMMVMDEETISAVPCAMADASERT